jgi:hypothetical protein
MHVRLMAPWWLVSAPVLLLLDSRAVHGTHMTMASTGIDVDIQWSCS